MTHVLNNEGTIEVCTGDDAGCQLIISDTYIIAYPEDGGGVATFGADDEEHCIDVMSLVVQEDHTDFTTAKTAVENGGGLVFLNGAQL